MLLCRQWVRIELGGPCGSHILRCGSFSLLLLDREFDATFHGDDLGGGIFVIVDMSGRLLSLLLIHLSRVSVDNIARS
jgi:hypothetical protein